MNELYGLVDGFGKDVLMRDGRPFRYTSEDLARRGKKALDLLGHPGTTYRVRPVGS